MYSMGVRLSAILEEDRRSLNIAVRLGHGMFALFFGFPVLDPRILCSFRFRSTSTSGHSQIEPIAWATVSI